MIKNGDYMNINNYRFGKLLREIRQKTNSLKKNLRIFP